MPKLFVSADIHLANHKRFAGAADSVLNARAGMILSTLGKALDTVSDVGDTGSTFIVAGDVFDVPRPHPALIGALNSLLVQHPGVVPFLMLGNHDVASATKNDNALAAVAIDAYQVSAVRTIQVQISSIGTLWADVVMVPFCSKQTADSIYAAVRQQLSGRLVGIRPLIVITHAGIADTTTPQYLLTSETLSIGAIGKLSDALGIDVWLSGDWHKRKRWTTPGGRDVWQIGALCPTGFDNPGADGYGSLIEICCDMAGKIGVTAYEMAGPRFHVVTSTGQATKIMRADRQCHPFFSLRVPAVDTEIQRAALTPDLKDRTEIVGLLDQEAQTRAVEAARGVRAAETVDQAAAAFCDSTPTIEDDVRKEVAARVQRLLAAAEATV